MPDVQIVSVQDRPSWKAFVDLPYQLYRNDPYWVAPLRVAQKELFDTHKHPFYAHAEMQPFLARRGDQVCGRVAAIIDRSFNEFHAEQAGFFGFFESIEDPDVARALLEAARQWLRERGVQVMRGPMNPSTNYECGMLIEGFDSSPMVMMTYNPPSYPQMMEALGMRKAKDLLAYQLATADMQTEKLLRVADQAGESRKVSIRTIRMNSFDQEVEMIWNLYNSAWERNWGFVPMSRDEFHHMAAEMKQILRPDFVLVGEVDGRPVGFVLALPDINQALKHAKGKLFPLGLLKILYYQRSIHDLRVIALGVIQQYRRVGVAAGFYAALFRNGSRLGIRGGEMSWILEDNILMNRSLRAIGAKPYKKYRIYEWN